MTTTTMRTTEERASDNDKAKRRKAVIMEALEALERHADDPERACAEAYAILSREVSQ